MNDTKQRELTKAQRDVAKLAKFFMEEWPDEIKEGSAVDNAIRLLRFDKWYLETEQPK